MCKRLIYLVSFVLVLGLTLGLANAGPIKQVVGFDLVLIEAENFHNNISQGDHEWQLATEPGGFSGTGFMRAMPDSGANVQKDYVTLSPRLDYEVNFVKTGTLYVWVRCLKTGGGDDSCHIGIDGQEGSDAENISVSGSDNTWNWSNERRGNLGRAKLEVTSPGVHTINVWMREDGFRLDKINLTTDGSYKPSDEVPSVGIIPAKVEPKPIITKPVEPEPAKPEPIITKPIEPEPVKPKQFEPEPTKPEKPRPSEVSPSPDRQLRRADSYVKEGAYLGIYFTQVNMSGDFDDTRAYSAPGEILDVPKVNDGTGFGVVLGARASKGAFEIGYQRSRHDTSATLLGEILGDSDTESTYNVIDFNFKIDVFARNQIRPYILFGFGIPWLTVENGLYEVDYDYDTEEYVYSTEDATFFGFALNAGAGVAYYFHPQLAVTGGLIYRWNWFTSAEGRSLDDNLLEKAFCLNIGIAYTF
jgi:hypothetical protein